MQESYCVMVCVELTIKIERELMECLFEVLLLTLIAGLAIPLGGIIQHYVKFKSHLIEVEVNHFVVAFGGGALLSAVALALCYWIAIWLIAVLLLRNWLLCFRILSPNL